MRISVFAPCLIAIALVALAPITAQAVVIQYEATDLADDTLGLGSSQLSIRV